MSRKRDYKAEYRRRLARGKALGLSRAQARGHPRKGEPPASAPEAKPQSDDRIEAAIRLMHAGVSMSAAAGESQLSYKRLKRFVMAHNIARLSHRKWVMTDRRPRRVPVVKGAGQQTITVPDFKSASLVGRHHNAIGQFVETGDERLLLPFQNKRVVDAKGRPHRLETDPNNLFRYAMKDEPVFHEIYSIVST